MATATKTKDKPEAPRALLPGTSVFPSFTPPGGRKPANYERKKLPPLDLDAIKVDAGVPMTPKRGGPGESRWTPLLKRLDKPGLSFALPAEYKLSVMTAARAWAKLHGGKFAVRIVSDSEFRVWRVS